MQVFRPTPCRPSDTLHRADHQDDGKEASEAPPAVVGPVPAASEPFREFQWPVPGHTHEVQGTYERNVRPPKTIQNCQNPEHHRKWTHMVRTELGIRPCEAHSYFLSIANPQWPQILPGNYKKSTFPDDTCAWTPNKVYPIQDINPCYRFDTGIQAIGSCLRIYACEILARESCL